jgi:hypothetical protein
LFLPCVLWTSKSYLHCSELLSWWEEKLHVELRIVHPSEFINLLLKLLVIEMAPSCTLLRPFARDDSISRVFKLLNLDLLTRVDLKGKICSDIVSWNGWDDNEWSLGWLIESIKSSYIVTPVVGLFIPLSWQ